MLFEIALLYGIIFTGLFLHGIFFKKGLSIMLSSVILMFLIIQINYFGGVEVQSGINKTTGAFTYTTLRPGTDPLLSFLNLGGIGLSIIMFLYASLLLMNQIFQKITENYEL